MDVTIRQVNGACFYIHTAAVGLCVVVSEFTVCKGVGRRHAGRLLIPGSAFERPVGHEFAVYGFYIYAVVFNEHSAAICIPGEVA